ncbi:MAG: TolC family protein [Cryomorphaceae bacterium]|jgi:outer membrane protein TolC|nr:TolC family protein [Cryomorphaceae bacterium]
MIRTFALAAALAISGATFAQTSLSLEQALDYAQKHNAQNKVRSLEQRAAEKVLWQNVALGLPSVTTAGQYTDNIELPAQFFDINQDGVIDKLQFGTRYTSLGNLSVNQLVFDGSYIVAVLATSVLRDQAALNREKTEIEVRQQTAQFYHLNVILSENEKVLSENLKLAQSTATQMAAMAKEGLAELENVDQINLVARQLEAGLGNIRQQKTIAAKMLLLTCGLPVEQAVVLTSGLDQLIQGAVAGEGLLQAKFNPEQHVDYRVLAAGRMGQSLLYQNDLVSFLPKVYAGYSLTKQYVSEDANVWNPNGIFANNVVFQSWNVSAQFPLFTSGRRVFKAQESRLKVEQLDVLLEQTRSAITVQHLQAKAEFENALTTYRLQSDNVALAKRLRDKSRIKFMEGVASSLEYSQAETQYQQTVAAMLASANETLNKRIALEKVLGMYNTSKPE